NLMDAEESIITDHYTAAVRVRRGKRLSAALNTAKYTSIVYHISHSSLDSLLDYANWSVDYFQTVLTV
ncbi:hypothetical protein J6590_089238, partial [Homalodisca vitripennis]